ncbi:MAG: hypothetical protein ABTD50_08700 [Polyangiaceae bacterium]
MRAVRHLTSLESLRVPPENDGHVCRSVIAMSQIREKSIQIRATMNAGTYDASTTVMRARTSLVVFQYPLAIPLALVALTSCSGTMDSGGADDDASPESAFAVDSGDSAADSGGSVDAAVRDATTRDAASGYDGGEDSTLVDAAARDGAAADSVGDAAPDSVTRGDSSAPDSGAPDASDASDSAEASPGSDACVENVLCIAGYHWDPTTCSCVAGTCISQDGGPCGGFTSNPCQCASGLECMTNPIPDIPGTCEPLRAVCDPIACGPAQTWNSTLCECDPPACTTGADCTGSLPKNCVVCLDGGSGCAPAHWGCSVGLCEVEYCP